MLLRAIFFADVARQRPRDWPRGAARRGRCGTRLRHRDSVATGAAPEHCPRSSRFSPRFRCGRGLRGGSWLRGGAVADGGRLRLGSGAGGGRLRGDCGRVGQCRSQGRPFFAARPLPAIQSPTRCNQSHNFCCLFVTLAISRLAPQPKASFRPPKWHRKHARIAEMQSKSHSGSTRCNHSHKMHPIFVTLVAPR